MKKNSPQLLGNTQQLTALFSANGDVFVKTDISARRLLMRLELLNTYIALNYSDTDNDLETEFLELVLLMRSLVNEGYNFVKDDD